MAIGNDATIETTMTGDNAESLFFNHLTDGKSPSNDEGGTEETKKKKAPVEPKDEGDEPGESPSDEPKDDEETQDEETGEEPSENEEGERKPKFVDDEESIVKVKVGDTEHEVPVKDLKRLFGQEKALTQKSQEVTAERKTLQDKVAANVAALDVMLQRAKDRFAPYEKINFFALAKDPNISAEEINALQEEARKAKADVEFFGQELENTLKTAQKEQNERMVTAAQEAHKVLSNPETGIEGWSQPLYDDIRNYAVSQGVPADIINSVTDPVQIKLVHKAMLYDKGIKAAAKAAKVVTTPKKVIKSASVETTKPTKEKPDAMLRLKRTGSTADAEDAFLSRINKRRD
jgi:hypothetical protein